MVLRQKTISVDTKMLHLWELKYPNGNFSEWVRKCMALEVLPDVDSDQPENSSYTLDDVPSTPHPITTTDAMKMDPIDIPDRAVAEARAREILSHFKQSKAKTEEQVKRFLARWDALHSEEDG
jgi:hypothetical protein